MRRILPSDSLLQALLILFFGIFQGLFFLGCGDGGDATGGKPFVQGVPTGNLSGFVMDRSNGRLLDGVQVRLEQGTQELLVETGLEGRYSFQGIASGSYLLTAFLPSHQLIRKGVQVDSGAHVEQDLRLERVLNTGAAELLVVDSASGVILPGVEIQALDLGARATTNAAGKALFTNLSEGEVRFQLDLPGYRQTRVFLQITAGQITTPEIVLRRLGGTLEGTVTTATSTLPLPGVLVSLPGLNIETVTAIDGRYRLLDIPGLAELDVIFSQPSHSPQLLTTAVVASRVTTLNVVMVAGFGLVQGTVRQSGGGPIAAARVSIPEHKLTTSTSVLGEYRFDLVPAETTVSVGVEAAGHSADSALIVVPPNGFVVQDFTLGSTTGSIAGTLLQTGTGAPIPGGLVTIPNLFRSTSSNASGAFLFANVPAQIHLLRIQATGYSNRTTSVEVPPGVTVNSIINLIPLSDGPGTGSLNGRVTNAATGEGVGSALISFPALTVTTRTSSLGNYQIRGLEARSSLQLIVNAAGYQDLTTTTAILANQANVKDLQLIRTP